MLFLTSRQHPHYIVNSSEIIILWPMKWVFYNNKVVEFFAKTHQKFLFPYITLPRAIQDALTLYGIEKIEHKKMWGWKKDMRNWNNQKLKELPTLVKGSTRTCPYHSTKYRNRIQYYIFNWAATIFISPKCIFFKVSFVVKIKCNTRTPPI